ncbi:hypothetical protein PIIN_01770 [Serendipita indica DSM 11827]|uniref:Integrase catalytic domain-containing protein n=1 Tax=Serendipita indica (strain DSM 11827) TaxID=1109443 RepID=G4T9D2_SERID|nr:hypothetical protein PIIN_01770 [Serendipita indica DSM 11827]
MHAETELGVKIKCLRDDKGGEYMSTEFQNYCAENGIQREHTIRDSPQQNGVAERFNRHLAEGVTAMLSEAKLPPSFWADAARAFVHTHNRLPSSVLDGITPIEIWNGSKPSVGHLRAWGCRAHVHLQKDQRVQLAPHTRKCVFIGYPNDYKGWIFWDPQTQKDFVSDSAIFVEDEFPGGSKTKSHVPQPVDDISPSFSLVPFVPHTPNPPVQPSGPPPDERIRLEQGQGDDQDSLPDLNLLDLSNSDDDNDGNGNDTQEPPRVTLDLPAQYRHLAPSNSTELPRETKRLLEHFEKFPGSLPGKRQTRSAHPAYNETADAAQSIEQDTAYVLVSLADGVEYALQTSAKLEPNTLAEALERPDSEKWLEAAVKEIDAHLENGTWEVVRLPHGKKAIGCRWVFKIKRNPDGSIDKYKGRIVAKGYAQREGVDYTETFAPTARFGALRTVIALAAVEDMELESVDISTAFLNGEIDAEVYMQPPEGLTIHGDSDGSHQWVLRLLKGLYGIKQGPRLWSVKLHRVLSEIGFKRLECDHSVFVYQRDGVRIIIPVHVDDLILASKSHSAIHKVKEELKQRFKIHDQGQTTQILGIRLERDRTSRTIALSQPAYIQKLLEDYNMTDCTPSPTPMPDGLRLSAEMSPKTAEQKERMKSIPYREAVGRLLYLSIATRPDISYAVGVLCRYNSNPGEQHWNAAKHVLRYLKGSQDLKLIYSPTSSTDLFTAHSDADLSGNPDNSRSTGGYVLSVGSGAVMWGSRLQKHVSLSSTESEYTTASAAGCEIMWMRQFLEEIGYDISIPSPLYLDSASAIQVVKNPEHQTTMKHVHRAYNWIREHVENKELRVQHVPTSENVADIFTKPLGRIKFEYLRGKLGLS